MATSCLGSSWSILACLTSARSTDDTCWDTWPGEPPHDARVVTLDQAGEFVVKLVDGSTRGVGVRRAFRWDAEFVRESRPSSLLSLLPRESRRTLSKRHDSKRLDGKSSVQGGAVVCAKKQLGVCGACTHRALGSPFGSPAKALRAETPRLLVHSRLMTLEFVRLSEHSIGGGGGLGPALSQAERERSPHPDPLPGGEGFRQCDADEGAPLRR